MSLGEKIREVMQKVEYLKKDARVSFQGQSYSALSEEKITTAVRQAMIDVGLVMFPTQQKITVVERPAKNGKDRDDIFQAEVTYTLMDTEGGNSVEIVSFGHGIDSGDKSPGKAMTYAYKYALLRTFAIPTGEDPDRVHSDAIDADTPAKTEEPKKEPMKPKSEEDMFQKIVSYCKANPEKFPDGIGQTMNEALDMRTKGNTEGLKALWEKINA